MSDIILYLICGFFLIGGIDYILGNKFKVGEKFEEGIKAMGVVGIGMIGIYSIAPILSSLLSKVFIPLSKFVNIDPSIFTSILFASDMGGYQMAKHLALSNDMALFSGIIIASSFGATISFTIPLALSIISKKDREYLSKGIMAGLITIPFGCVVGGLCQGIRMDVMIWNLQPIFIFAVILAIGLIKIPNILIKVFNFLGKAIVSLSIFGLIIQGIYAILGYKILAGVVPISETMTVVGKIAFVLGGAYPMLSFLNRTFKKTFENVGKHLKINSASVGGILGNLASNILIFGTFDEMNPKGKVICTAVGVSGAFVFGGQLGFISGLEPQMITPFIVSKFASGILSIFLASWLFEHQLAREYKLELVDKII